jgi:peptidoglycan/LPS O-acetylase OafA/YrhL
VYLMNQPVIINMDWRLEPWLPDPLLRTAVVSVLAMLLLIPCALLMSRLIEQPVARMADSLIARLQARRRAATGAPVAPRG